MTNINTCPCSVSYPTIVKSLTDLQEKNKKDIYLYFNKELNKTTAVYRCTRKKFEDKDYCWKHWDTYSKNKSKILLFSDVKDDPKSRIATIDDDFYSKKKKNYSKKNNNSNLINILLNMDIPNEPELLKNIEDIVNNFKKKCSYNSDSSLQKFIADSGGNIDLDSEDDEMYNNISHNKIPESEFKIKIEHNIKKKDSFIDDDNANYESDNKSNKYVAKLNSDNENDENTDSENDENTDNENDENTDNENDENTDNESNQYISTHPSITKSSSESDSDDDSDNESNQSVPKSPSITKSSSESDSDDDSEAELECEEIKSIDGKTYAIDRNTNNVYSIDTSAELGVLTEVKSNLSPIIEDDKYYIISKKYEYKSKQCLKCEISNLLFYDTKRRSFIGKIIKNNEGIDKLIKKEKL
jgi:hypothetical protein